MLISDITTAIAAHADSREGFYHCTHSQDTAATRTIDALQAAHVIDENGRYIAPAREVHDTLALCGAFFDEQVGPVRFGVVTVAFADNSELTTDATGIGYN